MNDDDLDSLIRETHPMPQLPAAFQYNVWSRIAVAEEQSLAGQWQRWTQNLLRWIAQPAPAAALVTAMLILGVSLGNLATPERRTGDLRTAYLTSINPLRATSAASQK